MDSWQLLAETVGKEAEEKKKRDQEERERKRQFIAQKVGSPHECFIEIDLMYLCPLFPSFECIVNAYVIIVAWFSHVNLR